MNRYNSIVSHDDITQDALRRFWTKINCEARARYSNTNCWEWTAGTRDGYGLMPCPFGSVRSMNAHRFSWMIHNGPVPDGLLVLHKCDNRLCVRPDHLFLGTIQENMDDRNAKNRFAKGEKVWTSTLTRDAAMQLLRLRPKGKAPRGYLRDMAERFGVSRQVVSLLWRGKTWRYLQ